MKWHRQYTWVFNSAHDAGVAVATLSDRQARNYICSLFIDDEQADEPVSTADVEHVLLTPLKAKHVTLYRVAVHFTFEARGNGEVGYSPYFFNGCNDLPKLATYEENPNDPGSYRISGGRPESIDAWPSPVLVNREALDKLRSDLADAISYGASSSEYDEDGDGEEDDGYNHTTRVDGWGEGTDDDELFRVHR